LRPHTTIFDGLEEKHRRQSNVDATLPFTAFQSTAAARGVLTITVAVASSRAHTLHRRTSMHTIKLILMTAVLLSAAACGNTWGERAVTGGAIGAGSGAAIGAVTGIGVLPGAVVGGVVGAGVGAATTPER